MANRVDEAHFQSQSLNVNPKEVTAAYYAAFSFAGFFT
jgi:hypothetical protein